MCTCPNWTGASLPGKYWADAGAAATRKKTAAFSNDMRAIGGSPFICLRFGGRGVYSVTDGCAGAACPRLEPLVQRRVLPRLQSHVGDWNEQEREEQTKA